MPQSEANLEKDGKKFILSENARKAASILRKSKYCREPKEKIFGWTVGASGSGTV
jgi:hypothetical protein